jgi:hypothetical protein
LADGQNLSVLAKFRLAVPSSRRCHRSLPSPLRENEAIISNDAASRADFDISLHSRQPYFVIDLRLSRN